MNTQTPASDEAHQLDVVHVHERRALLASLIDSSEDAVYSKDTHGKIMSWNPAAERLYGYAAREAIGRSISLIIPPHRSGEETEILARALAGLRIPHYETERLARDGRIVPVSLTVSPIRNAAGRILGASVIARDLTREREAERASALLSAIVESSPDAIIVQNVEQRIVTWNPAAERLYGFSAREAIGRPASLLVPPGREGEALRVLERVLAGEAVGPLETARRTKEGRVVAVSLTMWPLRDGAGRVIGACATAPARREDRPRPPSGQK